MDKNSELKKLEENYNRFIETDDGKRWKMEWESRYESSESGDFGDYLYDFYPEYLM